MDRWEEGAGMSWTEAVGQMDLSCTDHISLFPAGDPRRGSEEAPRKNGVLLRPWHWALPSLGLHPFPEASTHPSAPPLKKTKTAKCSGLRPASCWNNGPENEMICSKTMPAVNTKGKVKVFISYWSTVRQFSPSNVLMFNSLHVYSQRSVSVLRLRRQCKCNSSSPYVLHWRSCHFPLCGKHTQLEVWIFFARWHFLSKMQIENTQKHVYLWTGNVQMSKFITENINITCKL